METDVSSPFKIQTMEKKYTYIRGDYQRLLLRAGKAIIAANFTGGNTIKGILPSLTTSNSLVQHALESHHRFGHEIQLVTIDGLSPENWKKQHADEAKAAETPAPAVEEPKKAKKVQKPAKKQVKDVKTFNDAVDYFANLGAVLDSEEGLSALCEEFKVEFPNLKE